MADPIMERWKSGTLEEWNAGRVERWKSGTLEEFLSRIATCMLQHASSEVNGYINYYKKKYN